MSFLETASYQSASVMKRAVIKLGNFTVTQKLMVGPKQQLWFSHTAHKLAVTAMTRAELS